MSGPDALNGNAADFGEFLVGLGSCQVTGHSRAPEGRAQCLAQAAAAPGTQTAAAAAAAVVLLVVGAATPSQVTVTTREMLSPLET